MSIQIYGKEEDRQFVKRCLSRTANNFDYVIETGRNVEESDRQIRELTEEEINGLKKITKLN